MEVARLLGMAQGEVEKILITRLFPSQKDQVFAQLSPTRAEYSRDALAKVRGQGGGRGGIDLLKKKGVGAGERERERREGVKGAGPQSFVQMSVQMPSFLSILVYIGQFPPNP